MPRLAVNMLVLNGASVLRRCLSNLKGVVDELVVVDTGSTDGTKKILEEIAGELGLARFYYERLHLFGDDFFTDEAASFKMAMPDPFTGRRVCSDWAKARNLALDNTTADYVLKLDADDEVTSSPGNLLRTLDYLDTKPEVDLVSAPYEICDGHEKLEWLSMYARLWRRSAPGLKWRQPLHEYLGSTFPERTLFVAQGLRVCDHRDSLGEGVRIAHRNLKVLLRAWENHNSIVMQEDFRSDPTFRFTLAHEAVEVFPVWSRERLVDVMNMIAPNEAGMLADCHYHIGRSYEVEELFPKALEAYFAADETAPHTQALLRALEVAERLEDFEHCGSLRKTILARTGMGMDDPLPYNCDLKLLAKLRLQLGMYGTMIFHAPALNK